MSTFRSGWEAVLLFVIIPVFGLIILLGLTFFPAKFFWASRICPDSNPDCQAKVQNLILEKEDLNKKLKKEQEEKKTYKKQLAQAVEMITDCQNQVEGLRKKLDRCREEEGTNEGGYSSVSSGNRAVREKLIQVNEELLEARKTLSERVIRLNTRISQMENQLAKTGKTVSNLPPCSSSSYQNSGENSSGNNQNSNTNSGSGNSSANSSAGTGKQISPSDPPIPYSQNPGPCFQSGDIDEAKVNGTRIYSGRGASFLYNQVLVAVTDIRANTATLKISLPNSKQTIHVMDQTTMRPFEVNGQSYMLQLLCIHPGENYVIVNVEKRLGD